MPLKIRPADLRADRSLIVECLCRYLSPHADAARYDWLYLQSPHGPARAWIAAEEQTGETIGVASAFPRRAVLDGAETTIWVLGDFCIHDQYRTLGPALQLNRVCLDAVARDAAFWYDFPSQSMMAVYRRLRIAPWGSMVRYSRVLRWGRRLGRAVPVPVLREAVSAVASIADLLASPRKSPAHGLEVRPQAEPCGREFDDLDRARRGAARLHLDRSSAHLNWRYRAKPGARDEMLAARDARGLRGYAVYSVDGADAALTDLAALDDAAAEALVDEAAALARRRGAVTLSMSLLPSHAVAPVLRRRGFRPREESPVVLAGGSAGIPAEPWRDADVPFTAGDRES